MKKAEKEVVKKAEKEVVKKAESFDRASLPIEKWTQWRKSWNAS